MQLNDNEVAAFRAWINRRIAFHMEASNGNDGRTIAELQGNNGKLDALTMVKNELDRIERSQENSERFGRNKTDDDDDKISIEVSRDELFVLTRLVTRLTMKIGEEK